MNLKSAESTDVVTLLDEIILQRRIELWGEGFRRHDIARLNTGFIRVVPGENNMKPFLSSSISGASLFNLDPVAKSWELVMMIPTAEFDGNPAMDRNTDQNP